MGLYIAAWRAKDAHALCRLRKALGAGADTAVELADLLEEAFKVSSACWCSLVLLYQSTPIGNQDFLHPGAILSFVKLLGSHPT